MIFVIGWSWRSSGNSSYGNLQFKLTVMDLRMCVACCTWKNAPYVSDVAMPWEWLDGKRPKTIYVHPYYWYSGIMHKMIYLRRRG